MDGTTCAGDGDASEFSATVVPTSMTSDAGDCSWLAGDAGEAMLCNTGAIVVGDRSAVDCARAAAVGSKCEAASPGAAAISAAGDSWAAGAKCGELPRRIARSGLTLAVRLASGKELPPAAPPLLVALEPLLVLPPTPPLVATATF